jgi:hypothetical protein
MIYIVPLVFVILGLIITQIPTQSLLNIDSQTGKSIYLKTLRDTNNEEKALEAADRFYKKFGYIFVVFGVVFILLLAI